MGLLGTYPKARITDAFRREQGGVGPERSDSVSGLNGDCLSRHEARAKVANSGQPERPLPRWSRSSQCVSETGSSSYTPIANEEEGMMQRCLMKARGILCGKMPDAAHF